MSHTIVKSICITGNSVIITGASNNIQPRTYYTEEAPYYSEVLRTEGKIAVEKLILKQYFEGNFKGNDKYNFAVYRTLLHEKLDRQNEWDKCNDEEYEKGLLTKFHYYLKNPPQKQLCFIRHIKTNRLLKSVTARRITFHPNEFRIFKSVDSALCYLQSKPVSECSFEIVPAQ